LRNHMLYLIRLYISHILNIISIHPAIIDLHSFPTRRSYDLAGKKALHGRMEFEAFDAVFLDQLARFAHAQLALVRIDADKGYQQDRKSTRLNSSHLVISYAVFCLKKEVQDVLPNHDSIIFMY